MTEQDHTLKVTYTEEEIDIILDGDRRKVDKFMLNCMNEIRHALIEHKDREDEVYSALNNIGGIKAINERAAYVDALIKKANVRAAMMEKVSQSTVTWALIAFLGFLAAATWHEIVAYVKSALTGTR